MKYEFIDQNVLVFQEDLLSSDLLASFHAHDAQFQSKNIIFLVADNQSPTAVFIDVLLEITEKHQQHKKSFVVVSAHWNNDEVPEVIVLVPTLQEAIDLIEMDEMQRDLGF